MNITQERYSLIRLWLESFKVVNRCVGKLLWLLIVSCVLFALVMGVLVLTMGTAGVLGMLKAGSQPQFAGVGVFLAYAATNLFFSLYGIVFWTVCCRIIANQAQEIPQTLADTFSSSIIPSLYQIVCSLLLFAAMVLVGIVAALLARVSIWIVVLAALLFVAVGLRLCYTFIAIAVADKGPIEAIRHSWEMTSGKGYLDALLMMLMTVGACVLLYLLFIAIFYGFMVMIPLHFANSFSLAHLSPIWIVVALLLGMLMVFGYFVILAFPILVFVNRNAVLFDARNIQTDTTFIPLPELEIPNLHPNPKHMQQSQSTVSAPILTEDDLNQARESTAAPAEPEPAAQAAAPAPTAQPKAQELPSLEGLEVSQSSINTSETDTDSLSKHLDEVYTPKNENLTQSQEEDRMPTILFDDEMAKQLSKNQAQFAPKPDENTSDKKDNGPDSIKMSKF